MIERIFRTSKTEVSRLRLDINDSCKNGYNNFKVTTDTFSSVERRTGEAKIIFEGKAYYDIGGGVDDKDLNKLFPEFIPFFVVDGCDTFGVCSYPIINGHYFLHSGDVNACIRHLRISVTEAAQLTQLSKISYTAELLKMLPRMQSEADAAIEVYNKYSDTKYTRTENISYTLYNDMHYEFITQKDGWNVCNGMKVKPTKYP